VPRFNLNDYEPVEERIPRFWGDHPKGRIVTRLLLNEDGRYVVEASLYRDVDPDGEPAVTGLAEEHVGAGMVNETSALENCETSAIGRALANMGYDKKRRPSREEMEKVARSTGESTAKSGNGGKTADRSRPRGGAEADQPTSGSASSVELSDLWRRAEELGLRPAEVLRRVRAVRTGGDAPRASGDITAEELSDVLAAEEVTRAVNG
jgi:hypothetical protein